MDEMDATAPADLAALLGSRICHDLVNPLGALANGLELLAMEDPRLADLAGLLGDSLTAATVRVQFFRIAFGTAPAERMPEAQIRQFIDDYTRGKRLKIAWQAAGDRARGDMRMVFLMLLCLETAMPRGGEITIEDQAHRLIVTARANDMRHGDQLWQALTGAAPLPQVTPALVQFALAHAAIQTFARPVVIDLMPGAAQIVI